ncbi:Pyridoxal biosynthesis lyase PdxS [Pelotomaculum schinkii]|uniref:Pyridoxal biosynthesis lyase PdxS n=1 Tax=Pelotomaculum schinkii TaxID=78350 RepID=A0A4Y7REC0_9FIRM|nr:Pyridoxal biosynthesis lyase PdxS [Pelotomaculum schinkii]TEB16511.1 Pyridoxal biosynthesis lyase PdxS [Pelotomaculum sp. FP]
MVENGTLTLKKGLAEMFKNGVLMDVTSPEQAKIAEEAGACAVMALERVPADIRAAVCPHGTGQGQGHCRSHHPLQRPTCFARSFPRPGRGHAWSLKVLFSRFEDDKKLFTKEWLLIICSCASLIHTGQNADIFDTHMHAAALL